MFKDVNCYLIDLVLKFRKNYLTQTYVHTKSTMALGVSGEKKGVWVNNRGIWQHRKENFGG